MPKGSERVLLVEDEKNLRILLCQMLASLGYEVITAEDGQKALDLVNNAGSPFDIVVTDVVMPNMDGPDFVRGLKKKMPDTGVIFISGFTQNKLFEGKEELAKYPMLSKPFSKAQLAHKIREVVSV